MSKQQLKELKAILKREAALFDKEQVMFALVKE